MPEYEVTVIGEVKEVYAIQAESEDAARRLWTLGLLVGGESYDMEVDSIRQTEED
jgi:hypothetical protein